MASPPYPLHSLSPPLTQAQRDAMVAYLLTFYPKDQANEKAFLAPLKSGSSDTNLIFLYDNTAQAHADPPSTQIPVVGPAIGSAVDSALSPLTAIGSFVTTLAKPETWARIAEFAVGIILLGVGLNHALKDSTGIDAVGSAVKTAKSANAASAAKTAASNKASKSAMSEYVKTVPKYPKK